MKYVEPLFRPPSEADSIIFQVAYGCPHNQCRFCGMYKQVKYQLRPEVELIPEIIEAGYRYADCRRVFLADGDVMAMPFERLLRIVITLNKVFPRLSRINLYANGSSIMKRSDSELKELKRLKVNTLYTGLESGSQEVLDFFGKSESVLEMIDAVNRAQEFSFKSSVMILLGLGGKNLREEHIVSTVSALNIMQPKILSALRFIQIPKLPPPKGFVPASELECVTELHEIISGLKLHHTVFRANHSSNPLPLAGRLPGDYQVLLNQLQQEINSGMLDEKGPGMVPLFL